MHAHFPLQLHRSCVPTPVSDRTKKSSGGRHRGAESAKTSTPCIHGGPQPQSAVGEIPRPGDSSTVLHYADNTSACTSRSTASRPKDRLLTHCWEILPTAFPQCINSAGRVSNYSLIFPKRHVYSRCSGVWQEAQLSPRDPRDAWY